LCECLDWEDARQDEDLVHLSYWGAEVGEHHEDIRALWTDDAEDHNEEDMIKLGRFVRQVTLKSDARWQASKIELTGAEDDNIDGGDDDGSYDGDDGDDSHRGSDADG
jgi:hypothetical protein